MAPHQNEFVEWIIEQLADRAPVRARAMFGGYGLYLDQLFIAIVYDDVLYLKADQDNRARFEAAQSAPFRYQTKHGKTVTLSFYEAPADAMDDPDQLLDWVRDAAHAAQRAAASKRKKA